MIEKLPTYIEINGKRLAIRNKCDYRVVLDVISALNDVELSEQEKLKCALYIFYEDIESVEDFEIIETATKEMMRVINNGEDFRENNEPQKPPIMNWEHDFKYLVAPINRVLSCEIREIKYLHWWTLLSAYMEIGECLFSTIINIRRKKRTGKKLDDWEREFYRDNREMVDLPTQLTEDEKEFLYSE